MIVSLAAIELRVMVCVAVETVVVEKVHALGTLRRRKDSSSIVFLSLLLDRPSVNARLNSKEGSLRIERLRRSLSGARQRSQR